MPIKQKVSLAMENLLYTVTLECWLTLLQHVKFYLKNKNTKAESVELSCNRTNMCKSLSPNNGKIRRQIAD